MTDKAAILADLARVKALFQARAIAAAMGFPQPTKLPSSPPPYPRGGVMALKRVTKAVNFPERIGRPVAVYRIRGRSFQFLPVVPASLGTVTVFREDGA